MQHPNVKATPLPDTATLHSRVSPGDFMDCYCVDANLTAPAAAQIIVEFPGWAKGLLALRNLVTRPIGLKNEGPAGTRKIGIFPVESETDTQVIAGFNDRHLNFRVCVLAEHGKVYLATWVHPHNIGGRLYLAAIMPFHIAISRNALVRVARQPSQPVPQ
ncbi:MAG: DUF2867 domain-containing protein [Sulfitobacter sp.]